MKQRILTGAAILILLAIGIVSKIWTPYVFDALVLTLSIIGAYEIAQAMNKMGRQTSVPFSIAYAVLLYGGICAGYILKWIWSYYAYYYILTFVGLAILVFITQLFVKREQQEDHIKDSWDVMINTVFTFIYPVMFFSTMYFINHFNEQVAVGGS